MNNHQSKFALGQKVFIPRLNETGEIFGVTFYKDQVTYQLQAHSYDGEIGENEICEVEEWPKVGQCAFLASGEKICRVTIIAVSGVSVTAKDASSRFYSRAVEEVFKTAEECRAAIPVVE